MHTNAGIVISNILVFKGMLPPILRGPWKCQQLLSSLFVYKEFCAIEKGSPLSSKLHFIQSSLFHFVITSEYSKVGFRREP